MNSKIKVSASILSADFSNLASDVKVCEDANVDMLHVDAMDGHFVPVLTIGPLIIKAIRPITKLTIDAHLMVENPSYHIDSYIDAGADIISLHAECYGNRRDGCRDFWQFPKEVDSIDVNKALNDIHKIKQRGKKVFFVLNPGTPLCIKEILKDIDGVLIMSVNPGFSGQKFMPEVMQKLRNLRDIFDKDIVIDGGINKMTAPVAVDAGANILVTASYFFGSENKQETVKYLKTII